MNLNFRRILGTASAVAALMGSGVLAVAAPASAQPWPARIQAAAATQTAFPLNGIYTDDGGVVRLRITDDNDALTIDMSSLNRPTAWGVVTGTAQIAVTFPDAGRFLGTLVAPGTINWDNHTSWHKLATVAVPDVVGLTKAQAVAVVQSAGLVPVAQSVTTCDTQPGRVDMQLPAAGVQTLPGTLVQIFIAKRPPTCV